MKWKLFQFEAAMKHKSLMHYFVILTILCTAFIAGAKALGEQGMYLAQGYMMTPAIAALITRLFFHAEKFKDANPRLGRLSDYGKFWLVSLGITSRSYFFFTLLGAISWDVTGVGLSAERVRKIYGLVYPRDTWWTRVVEALENFFFKITRNPFRIFVHPEPAVEAILGRQGFRKRFYHQDLLWDVAVCTR